MPTTKYYPPPAFAFSVGIASSASPALPGTTDARFQEISGIDSKVDIEDVIEGGLNAYVHRLPGVTKHSNLVLKRGYVAQKSALADWAEQCIGSSLGTAIATKTIIVVLLGPDDKALVSWTFLNAWPVKWEVGPFDSERQQVLTETLELAYTDFTHTTAATGG